ncbi:MAG: DNA/RNA nuclease SfsA [Chloroflexota bacterium]|nr:DNA/RNA nuclease SfsA [Chloroflexota bacterium]
MRWHSPLVPGRFIARDNRFRASACLEDGRTVSVHVANSGRLSELFRPDTPVWIRPASAAHQRKTWGDLTLVEYENTLVAVDARLPNHLVAEALRAGKLRGFSVPTAIQSEVTAGRSRLDFLLTFDENKACWMETKSVTLVQQGTALFPDAPTERGVRHLRKLLSLHRQGNRTAVVFVVQREDAQTFSCHPTAHPTFTSTLREVASQGVGVYACRCKVTLRGSEISGSLPVVL